jgi:hypothetical protein
MPNNRKTHEWFVEQADLIYGKDAFIYLERYETARKPITIKCIECGREFKRVPNLHLRQPHGCISCAQMTERCTEISPIQHEILEGLIISDGCVHRFRPADRLTTPTLQYKSVESEFVDFLVENLPFKEFSKQIIEAQENIDICGVLCNQRQITKIETRSDKSLIPYWERWYNGEAKHVPEDFVLTPLTARVWFYGDGSSSIYSTGENDTSRVTVRFCTQSFTWDDCERLCELWKAKDVPFHVIKDRDKPMLVINKADYVDRFFTYIGEPEIESFRYKWKSPNPSRRIQTTVSSII